MDLVKEYNEKSHFKNANDIFEVLADVLMSGTIRSEYKNHHKCKVVFVTFAKKENLLI